MGLERNGKVVQLFFVPVMDSKPGNITNLLYNG